MGWTTKYAIERLLHQEVFGPYLESLSKEFPDTFTGGYTKNRPSARSWVLFKGDVPKRAIEIAADVGIEAEFLGGAKYSLAELEALSRALQHDLQAIGFEAGTGYSIEAQRVEVSLGR